MSELLSSILGLIIGIGGKIIYDTLAEAYLEIEGVGRSFLLRACRLEPRILRQAEGPAIEADVLTYRVKVTNRQKRLLNAPARNCVAWLDIDGAPESYQLCWVGAKESVTINVGDSREIDLCGLPIKWGVIIAPTESGYNFPAPRLIGDAGIPIVGKIRVTSENGRRVESVIRIEVEANLDALRISLGT